MSYIGDLPVPNGINTQEILMNEEQHDGKEPGTKVILKVYFEMKYSTREWQRTIIRTIYKDGIPIERAVRSLHV